MSQGLTGGLIWLLASLLVLFLLQRWLHREIQILFLIMTRRAEVSLVLFSLIFLPGVFIHEASHFLLARLLGVRTGRFSVTPQAMKNGRLQMGFVEVAPTDYVRDALIGLAPLLAGGALVAYIGLVRMNLLPLGVELVKGQFQTAWQSLSVLPQQTDFWLWFYIVFVLSSTMFPSASDRRAWVPIGLVFTVLLAGVLIAGAGPWLLTNFAPPLSDFMDTLTAIFGVSLGVHALLLVPTFGLRLLITRLTGLKVETRGVLG